MGRCTGWVVSSILLFLFARDAACAVLLGRFHGREPGSNIHLTTAGSVDWVHWGLTGTAANRKAGISPVIGNVVLIGGGAFQVTNSVEFSWSNGTPTTAATNVLTSIGTRTVTNGFSTECEAETTLYKLKVYAGVYAARGQLSVTLEGSSPYVDYSLDSAGATNGLYVVDVVANKNKDKVKVTFTASALHDTNGYVTLQAVALDRNSAPTVSVTSPGEEGSIVAGSPAMLTAEASDSDGAVRMIEFFLEGTIPIGSATNAPFQIAWTPTTLGAHTLVARAIDSNGAQTSSAMRRFFVTGTNGFMVAGVATAPPEVNLTTEGVSDWTHWGLLNENSVNRKSGVAPQIGPITLIGTEPTYSYADNQTTFTWTDGTPNLAIASTPTGIFVAGRSNGFRLTVPADPSPRTLKIYLGSYGARGKLTATLSDFSGPVFIDRAVDNVGNGPASVYTFDYAAGTIDQTLDVTFTSDYLHDSRYGNVTLQAATLASAVAPFSIGVVAPTNNAVFPVPANIRLEAAVTGGAGLQRTVEFFQESSKLGQSSAAPYVWDWNNVPTGNYTITARTTDNGGVMQTSAPVQVFVTTTGGMLNGRFNVSDSTVDLTAEGTDDWVHWGLVRRNSVNRKSNVSPRISNFSEIGRGFLDQYSDNRVGFSWADGTPTASAANSTTGIFKYDLHNGFQITVPADQTFRRLRLYVGVFAAQGEFEASLSDVSAAPFIDSSLQAVYDNATAVYTVDFAAASPGQVLRVRYTSKALFDANYGNVTLQAATLSFVPAVITHSLGTDGMIQLRFRTHPGWDYFLDGTGSLVEPQQWHGLTNLAGTGGVVGFLEPLDLLSNRFYRLRMVRPSSAGQPAPWQ